MTEQTVGTEKEKRERKQKRKQKIRRPWNKTERIIFCVFVSIVVLLCLWIFLRNYDSVYNDYSGAGWLPPSFGVAAFYHVILPFWAALAVGFLKLVFVSIEKKIRVWHLLLTALILPILCYHINYHALKEDGVLHPVVDDGGILNFIVIGDFNLDGMNDELYHRLYDEREYAMSYGTDEGYVDMVKTKTIGVGDVESCFASLYVNNIIKLHLDRDDVTIRSIEMTVTFFDSSLAEKVSFFEISPDGDIPIPHTVNADGTVSLAFDADTCAEWQETSEKEWVKIQLRYEFSE